MKKEEKEGEKARLEKTSTKNLFIVGLNPVSKPPTEGVEMNLSRMTRHLMFVAVLATSHAAFGDIIPDGTRSNNNGTATSHGFDRGSVVVLTLIALGILGTVFFRRVASRSRA